MEWIQNKKGGLILCICCFCLLEQTTKVAETEVCACGTRGKEASQQRACPFLKVTAGVYALLRWTEAKVNNRYR